MFTCIAQHQKTLVGLDIRNLLQEYVCISFHVIVLVFTHWLDVKDPWCMYIANASMCCKHNLTTLDCCPLNFFEVLTGGELSIVMQHQKFYLWPWLLQLNHLIVSKKMGSDGFNCGCFMTEQTSSYASWVWARSVSNQSFRLVFSHLTCLKKPTKAEISSSIYLTWDAIISWAIIFQYQYLYISIPYGSWLLKHQYPASVSYTDLLWSGCHILHCFI